MELVMRDHKIFQMKAEIENRKKILCAKRQELAKNTRENIFLTEVANDYDKYNKHMISQRMKQISFFQTLNQYIDNITDELQLTDSKLKESKQQQREITTELENLKNELDYLVKDNTFE